MTLILAQSVVGGASLSVQDLLANNHAIPANQRDYVWSSKEVSELWSDVINLYRRVSDGEKIVRMEGYFLGAMVVIRRDDQPDEVVDGQQRLTALSTMMSVLLAKLGEMPISAPIKSGFEAVAKNCLGKFIGAAWQPNLRFSDPNIAEFFLSSCLTKESEVDKRNYWASEAEELLARKKSPPVRIKDALEVGFIKLAGFLGELDDANLRNERFVSFFRLVTECVVTLRITAQSHSNAYAVFESLNNRGVKLSQADLIKNELLRAAGPSGIDSVGESWSAAKQATSLSELMTLPEFVHLSYLSRFKKKKANELFDAVKLLVSTPSAKAAEDYAATLAEDALALDALERSHYAGWSAATSSMLKDINGVLGIKMCYPYLFAAFAKHADAPVEFENHVRLIMNFAFRFMKVIEGGLEQMASHVNEACIMLNLGKTRAEIAIFFREKAPDDQFVKALSEISISNTKLAYFAIYYIEKVKMTGALPITHGIEQNLEHIMPKAPHPHWPLAAAMKASNPEQFKEYLWRLGNLLPLPEKINKSLRNKSIHHKISNGTENAYDCSTLGLKSPQEVSGYLDGGEWTPQSIERRQREMAQNFGARAWAL